MSDSMIDKYITYVKGNTESPLTYHRWCMLTSIGALAGRRAYIKHGFFRCFPNLYTMLIGEPAARKSTAIKVVKRLVTASGYRYTSADRTSREKFLIDLAGNDEDEDDDDYSSMTTRNLWREDSESFLPRESFIMADEFNDFAGQNAGEFYTTLGNLWDWDDEKLAYKQRFKNSKSISIYQPFITILGGNTPEGLATAFPPEVIGKGFPSRVLFIYAQRTGVKITWPKPPAEHSTNELISCFAALAALPTTEYTFTSDAISLLDKIYQAQEDMDDIRFRGYSNRRFTQLLKLCLIHALAEQDKYINESHVLRANTTLVLSEIYMPYAMGEFGKSRTSDINHKVLELIRASREPMTLGRLWAHLSNDLEKQSQLSDILQGLVCAKKIQLVLGGKQHGGFLPVRAIRCNSHFVDFNYLTAEETQGLDSITETDL